MATTITADNAGLVLRRAVDAAKSEIPNAALFVKPHTKVQFREELEGAYDRVWNKILDCYEVFAKLRDNAPLPFVIDPDGTAVAELEIAENLLRQAVDKLPSHLEEREKIVRITQAAIDILQNLRWLILINDGFAEDGGTTIYKDGESFMASMGL